MKPIVRIHELENGGQAEQLGMKSGDIIVSYNGLAISTVKELTKAIMEARDSSTEDVSILVNRSGHILNLSASTIPLGLKCIEEPMPMKFIGNEESYNITNYNVARIGSKVISIVGLVLVLLGLITAVIIIANAFDSRYGSLSLIAVSPSIGAIVSGILLIMGAQIGLAIVNNANQTKEMLTLIKKYTSRIE